MKREVKKFILFFSFVIFFFAILSSIKATTYPCYTSANCTAAVTAASPGDIVLLNNSLLSTVGNGVLFNDGVLNITFDCQGNLIQGVGGSSGTSGVYLYAITPTSSASGNNTVRNCIISNFTNGIKFVSSRNIIQNITIKNSNISGITFNGGVNNTINNITVLSSGSTGISILSTGNNITNSNFSGNTVNFDASSAFAYQNNTIDPSNIVDYSYRVYYNYSISNYLFNLTNPGVIVCFSCNNVTYKNANLSHYNYPGLFFYNTTNSLAQNITSNNNYYGLELSSGSNDTLTNIVANNNSLGVFFGSGSNDTLINAILSLNNNAGFNAGSESSDTVYNVTSISNLWGIYLTSSSLFNLSNIFTSNNSEGFYFGGSNNNTITNSFIQTNNLSGIYFSPTPGQYNLFYNDYFNNSVQYLNDSSVTNYFNTTETPGTNIVGGIYIGGNYWAAPNGTGFSQTCTSSTNGICDTPYKLTSITFDYLPLTCIESWSCGSWGTCSPLGSQTRSCTDANFCQTYKYKPATSQGCIPPSQGGYNNYTTNVTTSGNITTASASLSNITSGSPFTVNINTGSIGVSQLTITTNQSISNANISIAPANRPTRADLEIATNGSIYQSFNISTTGLNDSNIANVTIIFHINISWFIANNVDPANTALYRNTNTTPTSTNWTALPTTLISQDANYYYFLAISPGFSDYTIFSASLTCDNGNMRCFLNNSQICTNQVWVLSQNCQLGCSDGTCISTSQEAATFLQNAFTNIGLFASNNLGIGGAVFYFVMIVVTSGAVVAYITLVNVIRRRRQKRK
jgi:PGF-pre-PGF domain-containing protein